MARTYEELLAAQTELAHFNPFHNPKNGQFAKGHGGTTNSSNPPIKVKDKTDGNKRKSFMEDIAAVSTDRSKTNKRLKKALTIGAVSGAGTLLVSSALTKMGTTALNEAGIPIKLSPSVLGIGKKVVKDSLLAYGTLTIADAYKNKKRREYREQKSKG